jgi:hypothetical protein
MFLRAERGKPDQIPLIIRFSLWKSFVYLILSVTLGGGFIFIYYYVPELGRSLAFTLCDFVIIPACVILAITTLIRISYRDAVIRIDKDGVYSIFQTPRTIPWDAIKTVGVYSVTLQYGLRGSYISLDLKDDFPCHFNTVLWIQYMAVGYLRNQPIIFTLFLDRAADEICAAISSGAKQSKQRSGTDQTFKPEPDSRQRIRW